MVLNLKPQHIDRYKQIGRLLFKYSRSEKLRDGLGDADDTVIRDFASFNGPTATVHELPGDILIEQATKATSKTADGEKAPETPKDTATLARELVDDLEAMGPTFVKLGQFLSTRGDILPSVYLDALARLQDSVGPFSFEEVNQIVSEELGVRLSKAFAIFEEEPIAAASLGQVHRAQLRDGRIVAVKVQRPNIRERMREDLEALTSIAEVVERRSEFGKRHGVVAMVDEFRKTLMRELDYNVEARNLRILGENLAHFENIVVPSPVEDYVTSRVLTMQYITGRKVTALGPLARMELNGAPLAEDLCRAYLHQILVDGFFHADPHPGNIFLTDDGRLAFLDLGMVAQISPGMQESLLKLVLAISEGRAEDVSELVIGMGAPRPDADPEGVRREISEMVLEFQGLKMREIAMGKTLFESARIAADGGYRQPRELTLLGKTLLNVDEVARRLDPDFEPNGAIRRNAAEIMRHRMIKSLSPGRMFDSLLELKGLVEKLPRRLNQLIDTIAENKLKINVDAIDEALLMEGAQKVANRITMGLMISAMIVGAALLMRIETSFRILGYPGIAILFFLLAAIGAVFLGFNILFADVKAEKSKLMGQQQQKKRTAEPPAPHR
ncbi:MAG TPA: AarF/ABC1/UbiB kinase family protein [Candidatus Eisenbacteria bacterium]|nr:AarF/ABC1/UbiB kinase family protein [Candidatus Eisenbacteria bacterium]